MIMKSLYGLCNSKLDQIYAFIYYDFPFIYYDFASIITKL